MKFRNVILAAAGMVFLAMPSADVQAGRAVIVVAKPRPVKVVKVNGPARGVIDLNVKPKRTEVWVDGAYRGQVRQFDGYPGKLRLLPGWHVIKLVTPDGDVARQRVRVKAGHEIDVRLDLRD